MRSSRQSAQKIHGHDHFGRLTPSVGQLGSGLLAFGITAEPLGQPDQIKTQITQTHRDRFRRSPHISGQRRQPRRCLRVLPGIQQDQPLNTVTEQIPGQFRSGQTHPGQMIRPICQPAGRT